MLEDPPFDLLCPGRRPTGIGPVLLPGAEDGSPDWDGFAHLLGRIVDTPFLPGVNLRPGVVDQASPTVRSEVVATVGAALGGEPFVAGVRAEPGDDGGFDPSRLAGAVESVSRHSGVPVLVPSPALASLDPDEFLGLVAWMGQWCEQLLVVEAPAERWVGGRPPGMDLFGALMEVGSCVGVVHASGSRRAEWDRLARRDEERASFQVFSANESAIDQIMFGADHCLDLSAAVPDVVAERDEAWAADDLTGFDLADSLQFLASLVGRNPSASTSVLARILHLRGWLPHDRPFGQQEHLENYEDDLLRPALTRLGL